MVSICRDWGALVFKEAYKWADISAFTLSKLDLDQDHFRDLNLDVTLGIG